MVHFELVSDLQAVIRRDFPLADKSLANPLSSNRIIDGEFLTFNANYQLVRASDSGLGWAVYAERGRFDVQALGKVPVLYLLSYEADTRVYDSSGSYSVGTPLYIKTGLTIDGVSGRVGLSSDGTGNLVIGYVTRTPASNGQKLRFIQTLY